MISKNWLKFLNSLQNKKFRKEHNSFIIEGAKSVLELLNSDFKVSALFVTEKFHENYAPLLLNKDFEIHLAKEEELSKAGSYSNNNSAVAVAYLKENKSLKISEKEYGFVLDDVKDPGNLGTIIRIADWYGIKKIICSENSVDFYNPKVISATMGSFTRVEVYYCNIVDYLKNNEALPSYGGLMEGENIHKVSFADNGFIVLGNESFGINPEVQKLIKNRITIPRFGEAESLNVAIATAIITDNIFRSK